MISHSEQLQFIRNLPHKTYPAVRQRGNLMVGHIREFKIKAPGVYTASILGTYKYRLEIDCNTPKLHCDCPHFAKVLVCKHLVAFSKFLLKQDLRNLAWEDTLNSDTPQVPFTDIHLQTFQEIAKKESAKETSHQKPQDPNYELVYVLDFPKNNTDWELKPVIALKKRPNLKNIPALHTARVIRDQRIVLNHADPILLRYTSQTSSSREFQQVWSLAGKQGRLRNPENNQPLQMSESLWIPQFRLQRQNKNTILLSAKLKNDQQESKLQENKQQELQQEIQLDPAKEPIHIFGSHQMYLQSGDTIYPLQDQNWRPESYRLLEKQFLIPEDQLGRTLEVLETLNHVVEVDQELQPKVETFQPKVLIDIIEGHYDYFNIALQYDILGLSETTNPNSYPTTSNSSNPTPDSMPFFPYGDAKIYRKRVQTKGNYIYREPDQDYVEQQRSLFCQCLNNWSGSAALEKENPGILDESCARGILYIDPESFPETFMELIDLLNEHFQIRGLDLLQKYFIRKGKFNLTITPSGIDWLDLQVGAEFGGEHYEMQDILDNAYEKDGRTVLPLKDGSLGVLPPKLVKILTILRGLQKSHHSKKTQSLRVNPWHAGFIEELVEDPDLNLPARKEVLSELKKSVAQKAPRAKLPQKLNGKLRKYQKQGYQWLNQINHWKSGGILADDMGLGKTIQVLSLLSLKYQDLTELRPTLIVMPTSLLYNWQKEVEKFTPHLRTMQYYNNDRKDLLSGGMLPNRTLVFTTYTIMQRDIEILEQSNLFYAILDESQNIKNPTTQRHKAALRLQAEHRLVMTGTPVENNLLDLWAQFRFVNPGFLGNRDFFRRELASGQQLQDSEPDQSYQRLAKIVEPFYLRRTKGVVLDSLPPKEEHVLYVEMDAAQKKLYNKTREHFREKILETIEKQGMTKSKFLVLEALLRLRQVACAPQLFQPNSKAGSAKLDLIVEKLKEDVIENHKALAFSQFTSLLKLLEQRLAAAGIDYAYLDGTTRSREKAINSFIEQEEKRVFLISLKAGGVGLNLTAADYVFHLDPWWNPAVESQATDRAHRIGQKNRVIVSKMIAAETVEEKILQLQQSKKSLADAVIKSDKSIIRKLTPDMLMKLFES